MKVTADNSCATIEFANLFSTMKINGRAYKNRIVSAPMAFSMIAMHPEAGARAYRKIEACARGGAAAVIVGETNINYTDADRVPFPHVDFTEHSGPAFDAISRFAALIKKHGAVALIELVHPGSEKTPFPGQKNPVGPVSFIRQDGVKVDAASKSDIIRISREFAEAALFMKAAGFDGVLLHAGHGFLFTQFLSQRTNSRTDEYGGTSLENRARFPLEILREVRKEVGGDFIIDVRLSGEEGVPGGITAEETGQLCKMMEGVADSAHISSGLYTKPIATRQFSSMYDPHGCNADISAIIKKHTTLPVGVIGGVNSPELAEQILAEGKADYIILGRQMIADPEFPNKAKYGKPDEIRRCLRCFTCFPGSPEEGYKDIPWKSSELAAKVGSCTINPLANLHFDYTAATLPKSEKKVLVIGGGPAGMQASITCAERGHRVTLAEKENSLGGILRFTDFDSGKLDLRDFKDLLVREVFRCGVDVLTGRAADKGLIDEIDPDAIILALGSSPAKPPIPGIEHALPAQDIYTDGFISGKRVVMIGGGLVGCEAALHLAKVGHEITIIEILDRLADGAFGMYREALMLELEKCGVEGYAGARCLEISKNSARVSLVDGAERVFGADTLIYALGMESNSTVELIKQARNITVYTAGDCIRPAKVDAAIREGYLAGMGVV